MSFNSADAESYDPVALAFDRLSERYSALFAEKLLSVAGVAAGQRVLDLGAGSGFVSRRVLDRGAHCVAADLSRGMLQAARVRSANLGLVQMDAEHHAVRPRSFDAIVSLFAMLHFPDPANVLRQCAEALKPGGVLAYSFGSPAPWPYAALAQGPRVALDLVREQTGLLLKAPKTLHDLLDSRLPSPQELTETALATSSRAARRALVRLTCESGFTDVRSGWIRRRYSVDSVDQFWELQSVFSSRARKQLATVPHQQIELLREEFLAGSSRVLNRGGVLTYDVATTWIRAKRSQV